MISEKNEQIAGSAQRQLGLMRKALAVLNLGEKKTPSNADNGDLSFDEYKKQSGNGRGSGFLMKGSRIKEQFESEENAIILRNGIFVISDRVSTEGIKQDKDLVDLIQSVIE